MANVTLTGLPRRWWTTSHVDYLWALQEEALSATAKPEEKVVIEKY